MRSVGFRVNALWAVPCQVALSSFTWPPIPFVHEQTEQPFTPFVPLQHDSVVPY